ncbi:MAG: hypothetical protein IJU82_02975 [Ruminiclostridium sp.]|nr:hypothetical protein [Ruminiclostridium sp.]
MSKIRKITAILLVAIMLVCMFAVPAGAASIKAPKLYYEEKGDALNVYIDGIDAAYIKKIDSAIKSNETMKQYIKEYGIKWDYIGLGFGPLYDCSCWFNISKNAIKNTKNEGSWYWYNGETDIINLDVKYYKNKKNGLTNGYCVTIKNKTVKKMILDAKNEIKIWFYALGSDEDANLFTTKNNQKVTIGDSETSIVRFKDFYGEEVTNKMRPVSEASSASKENTDNENSQKQAFTNTRPVLDVSVKLGKANLSWESVKGAEGYEVYCSKNDGKSSKFKTETHTVTGTSFEDNALYQRTLKYKVRAFRTVNGKKVYTKWSKMKTIKN